MFTRTRLAAVAVAVVALAAVPSAASAQTSQLRGVVSGSPYGASNNSMAIPVLFSKMTARAAGLKSPVGVIILKRTQKVKLPGGGRALPVNLRTGDRFKGAGEVSAVNRRTFYPRVPLTRNAVVYFRSKEMSLAELTAAVQALQDALAKLKLPAGVDLTGLQNQIDELRRQLAALKIPAGVDLTGLQAQIDALGKRLDALAGSLPDLSQYVKLSDLTSLLGGYATKTYVDDAIAGLQGQIDALPTTAEVDALKSKVNEVVSGYTTLCAQLESVASLPVLTSAVNCPSVSPLP